MAADKKADAAPRGYERFWDMPFGGVSADRHIPKGVATVIIVVVAALSKLLFRYRVDHRERLVALARETGVVVVSNHTSFMDVVFLFLSAWPAIWPRFIGRDTLFAGKPRVFGWALSRLGVIPIKRDSADRTAIKRASTALKNREAIVILPEGTRRGKSGRAPEVHGGAALIARMGKAPILPMTVRDAENIKQKGRFVRFPRVTTEYGQPILLEDFDFLPKDQRLDGCAWYAMRECFALSRRCAPEKVDMVELFPNGYDFTPVFAAHPIPRHTAEEVAAAAARKHERAAGDPAEEGGN